MFNLIEELFAPGRKHTTDERKRLELSRVDLNTGDPGRGPMDLTSGKVTVLGKVSILGKVSVLQPAAGRHRPYRTG